MQLALTVAIFLQGSTAEETFKRIEEAVTKAKTLRTMGSFSVVAAVRDGSGFWIEDYDVGALAIRAGDGRRLRSSPELGFREGIRCEREPGVPTRVSGRRFAVPSADIEGIQSIRLEGEMSVGLVASIEERVIDWAQDRHELTWDGAKILLRWNGEVRNFTCKVSGKADPTPVHFHISALDEKDVWSRDLGHSRATANDDFEFPDEGHFLAKRPAKIILWKVSKLESVKMRFTIQDIPLTR